MKNYGGMYFRIDGLEILVNYLSLVSKCGLARLETRRCPSFSDLNLRLDLHLKSWEAGLFYAVVHRLMLEPLTTSVNVISALSSNPTSC
jgi:hypothetical protein